jgi:hypothetical protein
MSARGLVLAAPRPLGEILVDRGAIDPAELEDVLLEQRRIHKRLGAMLVLRGTLSPSELTDALREQLKALGPSPRFERNEGVLGIVARLLRPRQVARLHAGRGQFPELTRDLERRARTAGRRWYVRDEPRLVDETVGGELADLRSELNHTYRLVVTQGVQIAKLLARAPEVAEPTDDGGAEPLPVAGANAGERSAERMSFLLFKPAGRGGYELLEQDGRPPVVGETLEVDERRFTVTRIGRSPLPVDRRPCVYLQAL